MNDKISFVLNGHREDVRHVSPTTTLMNYLRRTKRLTGTKEGCAEGDCGACSVLVGTLKEQGIAYRAVNACIHFLPMVHGKSVVTVEALKNSDGALHPAQQAIVDYHGSQCGFCTPGFVMSLYTITGAAKSQDLQDISDTLAGNLCRCTGYGPLIEAARAASGQPQPPWDADRRRREIQLLQGLAESSLVSYTYGTQNTYRPRSSDELARLYEANPDAVLIAGATDVGLWVTKDQRSLPSTIHISQIKDLRFAVEDGDMLRVGAAATYRDVHTVLDKAYPDLGELIRRLGGAQVRNAGTLCGNIANGAPIGDTPPALIALGAELVLRKGQTRRRLALEDYFIAYGKQDRTPGEFIEAVEIPLGIEAGQIRCYKISKRFDQDISSVCGCFNITLKARRVHEARIAFGGMAGTPLRARTVEQTLIGQPWCSATIDKAAQAFASDFTPITDARGTAAYRLLVVRNLLRRYFLEMQEPETQTRLVGRGSMPS